ncbi:MAG: hypothetical protein ACK56I_25495, partial [bacterium]
RSRPVRAVLPSKADDSCRAVGGHREGDTLESGAGGDRHARRRSQGDIDEAVPHRDKSYQVPSGQQGAGADLDRRLRRQEPGTFRRGGTR